MAENTEGTEGTPVVPAAPAEDWKERHGTLQSHVAELCKKAGVKNMAELEAKLAAQPPAEPAPAPAAKVETPPAAGRPARPSHMAAQYYDENGNFKQAEYDADTTKYEDSLEAWRENQRTDRANLASLDSTVDEASKELPDSLRSLPDDLKAEFEAAGIDLSKTLLRGMAVALSGGKAPSAATVLKTRGLLARLADHLATAKVKAADTAAAAHRAGEPPNAPSAGSGSPAVPKEPGPDMDTRDGRSAHLRTLVVGALKGG
jgi:hypothetical protein